MHRCPRPLACRWSAYHRGLPGAVSRQDPESPGALPSGPSPDPALIGRRSGTCFRASHARKNALLTCTATIAEIKPSRHHPTDDATSFRRPTERHAPARIREGRASAFDDHHAIPTTAEITSMAHVVP